jgi:glycosyltransferase involved in cell wall biosynthesis
VSRLPPTLPGGRPWPRISVVTPSYNQGRYVEQTLLSVANQGYPNVEHIVIDGGSTDGTRAVLDRYRDRLAYLVSETDRGQSHAINKGFAVATGEILTWLNSDDMLAPGALAAVAMAFATSGADLVAGTAEVYRDGVLLERHLTSCPDGELPLDRLLDLEGGWNAGQFFFQPEVMFTRELWERAGGHVDEAAYYSMDYELWLRFAVAGARLHVIGRPVALFRSHPLQKTAAPERFRAELVRVRAAFLERTGRPAAPARPPEPARRNALRITFVNDIGFAGGAGIAHQRLAAACQQAGHAVTAVALRPPEGGVELTTRRALDAVARTRPDLLVVGNLHGAVADVSLPEALARRWPAVCVLHDFWLLSGRCAYPGGCTRYETGCDASCPTAAEYPALPPDRIAGAWKVKRGFLGSPAAPALLANSDWTLATARRMLGGLREAAPLARCVCGVPQDVYRPLDKGACRDRLGLPRDKFILLFSACRVDEERKGGRHLAEALAGLDLPDLLPVMVGEKGSGDSGILPGALCAGYVSDPRHMALLLGTADLFVGPSLEETFGQVFAEAASCGTPSVGYPVGGVSEAIRDGVTGRLGAAVTPAALREAIRELYRDAALRESLGRWGRLLAENEWSLEASYHRFLSALTRLGLADRLGLRPKTSFGRHAGDPGPVRGVETNAERLARRLRTLPRRVAGVLGRRTPRRPA